MLICVVESQPVRLFSLPPALVAPAGGLRNEYHRNAFRRRYAGL